MIGLRDPDTLNDIAVVRYRNAANALKEVAVRYRDAGNVLREAVGGSMTAEIAPAYAYGNAYSYAAPQIMTNTVSIIVEGGAPPYTYDWTITAGWTVLSPTTPYTAFRSPHTSAGTQETGSASVEVTDANGLTATSNIVGLSAINSFEGS